MLLKVSLGEFKELVLVKPLAQGVLREWPLVMKDGSNPWELARNASFRFLPKVWRCRIPEGGMQTLQVIPM